MSMQAELREPPRSIYDASLMIDLWMEAYMRVFNSREYLSNKGVQVNKYDNYNAAWALLSYVDNQCPKAIKIATIISSRKTKEHLAK